MTVDADRPIRALFVCSQNRLRSPTAERVFGGRPGLDVRSAGVDAGAIVPLDADLVAWADLIFVMERRHFNRVRRRFRDALGGRRVVCLYIPDDYDYMDEALVRLLEARVQPWLAAAGPAGGAGERP